MNTIQRFAGGLEYWIWYLVSSRELTLLAAILVLGLIIGLLYPAAVHIYPFWKGTIEYADHDFTDSRIAGIRLSIYAPAKLVVGKPNYSITVEATNLQPNNLNYHIKVSVNKNQSYVSFRKAAVMPLILMDQPIPQGATLIERSQFEISDDAKSRDPVELAFRIESGTAVVDKKLRLPVDRAEIPLVWLLTVCIPVVYMLWRFVIRSFLGLPSTA